MASRYRSLGERAFEIIDNISNVRAVVPTRTGRHLDGESAEVIALPSHFIAANDYHPFGMEMEGRRYAGGAYRYGFNGKERDDELKGRGNHYDLGARHYDPRVGRMLSLDPMAAKYPAQSPYAYGANNPAAILDYMGADPNPQSNNTETDRIHEIR